MSDNWDFYFCRIEDEPASIFVDLGIHDDAPLKVVLDLSKECQANMMAARPPWEPAREREKRSRNLDNTKTTCPLATPMNANDRSPIAGYSRHCRD